MGDCQVRTEDIRSGSIDISIGGFLRIISRVVRGELSDLLSIFIVTV